MQPTAQSEMAVLHELQDLSALRPALTARHASLALCDGRLDCLQCQNAESDPQCTADMKVCARL